MTDRELLHELLTRDTLLTMIVEEVGIRLEADDPSEDGPELSYHDIALASIKEMLTWPMDGGTPTQRAD